ncbi:MAG: tetratricopeptide repeat protein [Sumerlaeia bacterium]
MQEQNAYSVLGLKKGASDQQIKSAYFELVKKYDPEKHTDRFMVIKGAYDKLKDPKKRAAEDLRTYNVTSGEFLFLPEEKPQEGKPPVAHRVDEAKAHYENDPGDAEAKTAYLTLLMQRSYVSVTKKLWTEAIADWSEVQKIDPSNRRARNNLIHAYVALGLSYALHGLDEEALELWENALKLNPDNTDLIHNLALASEKADRPDRAAAYWSETIARWKKRLDDESDNEYLKECVIEAMRMHSELPSAPEGHGSHGSLDAPHAQGRASSTEVRRPAATSRPQQSSSSDRVATPSTGPPAPAPAPGGDRSASIQAQREILKLRPEDFDARYRIANLLMEGGQYEEAHQELDQLHNRHPKNIEVLNMMGRAQLHLGNVDNAFNVWNRSLSIDPKNASTRESIVRAHLTLGKSFRQKGLFTHALVHLKKLQRYMPQSPEVFMEIAATYDMKGDTRSAMQHYQRVLSLDPKNKVARKALNDLRLKR